MRAQETRDKILGAAEALIAEVGFEATTTRDIAERSGVNKALIQYHFRSKDELLDLLLGRYYDGLATAMAAALARDDDPGRQLANLVDAYADFLAAHRAFCSIVQREIAVGRHVDRIGARTLPILRLGEAWIASLVTEPDPDLDPAHLFVTVYGIVVTYFTHGPVLAALHGADPFSPTALAARKRHVRRVVDVLLRGLLPNLSP